MKRDARKASLHAATKGEFKEEVQEGRKRAFKQWGEIANKMGTLSEDIEWLRG
jgi:hypothetical protein